MCSEPSQHPRLQTDQAVQASIVSVQASIVSSNFSSALMIHAQSGEKTWPLGSIAVQVGVGHLTQAQSSPKLGGAGMQQDLQSPPAQSSWSRNT
jgi:hypothetical protein